MDNLELQTRPHRLPNRLDSPERQAREVDDIISLLTFADEQKVLDNLPIYVATSPESMPQLRMVDSDFRVLLEKMDKMAAMIRDLQEAVVKIQVTCHSGPRVPASEQAASAPPMRGHEAAGPVLCHNELLQTCDQLTYRRNRRHSSRRTA